MVGDITGSGADYIAASIASLSTCLLVYLLVGHVNLATGAVYEQRFGPDKKVGHVDLSNGRVYATRLGPDTHVGQVDADGRLRLHEALALDDYVARVDEFRSYAHAAGALLLLVMPALEAEPPSEPPQEVQMN